MSCVSRVPRSSFFGIQDEMTIQSFMPIDRLDALALELASRYAAGSPFPHIVIDNFLGATAFSVLAGAFPGPQHDIWYKFKSGKENLKLQSRELEHFAT